MEKCPTEILSLIFAEACTDDGRTGRSLSLLSRRIRNTSRRYALQSVALYGRHQLSAFASLLDQLDLVDRRVRHLYLTDRRRALMAYLPGQDREQWLKERASECTQSIRVVLPEYSPSAIPCILKAVCPTLQTLTLLLFQCYKEHPFSHGLHFPELRDLTVHATTITICTAHPVPPVLPKCPSLQRLHVVQDSLLSASLAKAVSSLGSPCLTHLRLSRLLPGLLTPEGDVAQDLERTLHEEDLQADLPSPASGRYPPTLTRVLVQMSHRRLPSPMVSQLKDIAMRDARRRIVLLKPAKQVDGETLLEEKSDAPFYMGIRAAWEQRVCGAESAVWDVEPSAILASYGYCAEAE